MVVALAARHGISADRVHIIDSVAAWCEARGINGESERRLGKAVREKPSGMTMFAMVRRMSDEVKLEDLGVLALHGFPPDLLAALDDDGQFVRHVALHEIARVLGVGDSKACYRWAFVQMGLLRD